LSPRLIVTCHYLCHHSPIATVLKTGKPLFIKDVGSSNLKRKDLALKYGIGQIAFSQFESGILEFGTSSGPSTADWVEMPKCPTMPKAAMRRAFENLGATYTLFWEKQGDKFVAIADYTTDARKAELKQSRGDDKSFSSESRKCTDIDAKGNGPIATAFKTGKDVTVVDTMVFALSYHVLFLTINLLLFTFPTLYLNFSSLSIHLSQTLKRAALAKEFGIKRMHFIPADGGVLEYGTPANAYLSGPTLEASLKMRCDTSGAGTPQ
jgi:hypothetical protein